MISVSRGGNDSFLNPETLELDVRPRYNIISYTRGRWRSDEYQAIAIEGTRWKVPAVLPGHFTPSEFDRVLRYVATQGCVNYVWVDVACINQGKDSPEDIAEGADQVGKQMSIFSQASNAYVWLCGTSSTEIKEILAVGLEAQFKLENELSLFTKVNLVGAFTLESESKFDEEINQIRNSLPIRNFSTHKEKVILGFLDSIEAALDCLTRDKWFSSL